MMRRDDLRAVLYHRLHLLLPAIPLWTLRRLGRVLIWGFWVVYFCFIILALVLRYSVLPHIEDYRTDIERYATQGLGQAVTIGRIEASWDGINPDLTLLDVRISDAAGRPALAFSRVEAILSWWSVPSAKLKLRLLRIDEPTLNLRRDREGRIFIAGIPLSQEQNDGDVSDWVLAQRRIRIQHATLVWEDELRQAPVLELKELNFALDNDGKRHRFGLTALPPEGLASAIDLRGDFRGKELDKLDAWSGKGYAQIDYADLAVWRQWIDYPVALPHGRGAVRAWVDFSEGRLHELTADLSLRDVNLRLAPELPVLELDHMSGRLGANFSDTGFKVSGRGVELVTRSQLAHKGAAPEPRALREALRIAPTDFHVEWLPENDGKAVAGSASASHMDLGVLARLAGYLPFDEHSRQLLNDYAPQGQVSGLSATWKGDASHLDAYSLKAGFEHLALKAQGYFPGFSGLSGALEADQKGGAATLRAQQSSIDLPSIFPEPQIVLDKLGAQAKWKISRSGVLDAELSHVEFSGPEAAGSAQGTYRNTGEGPGSIDMTASLTRGDARAVWRYMPHVVNVNARTWLHDSLLAGGASEAKLTLKGDLQDFPFLDKSKGQFLVTVKAQDVTLDYGKGWPRIEGISGDLRFEGNGMIVEARQGSILGAKLMNTRAEIPDFDAPISTLRVKGQADGATSDFLKFIDQSPVAERIDHFTEDMKASGNGHLDLDLTIPLDSARLGDSKIEGTYRFIDNEVSVDSALPPIRQVNGAVQFSGSDLRVPEINGVLFGGPLKVKGGLQKDGKVLISANGAVNIEQLRKQSDAPFLAHLSGTTAYRGEVHINKRNADLVVNSSLAGLASTLPEPFRKTAAETLPLRFEKKILTAVSSKKGVRADPVNRDQLSLSVGNALALQLIRRKQEEKFVPERGAIAIGQALSLPESGVSLGLTAKSLDLDAWRRVFQASSGAETPGKKAGAAVGAVAGAAAGGAKAAAPEAFSLMPNSISIKAPELLLLGRHYNDVDLSAANLATQWKIRLNSRQANGDLSWDTAGAGRLTARLKQLVVEPSSAATESDAGEAIRELPALDIIADEFTLGTRRFGRLELQARNEGGLWRLNRIQANNPFGSMTGSGEWRTGGGRSRTELDFKIDSSDVGKMLERFGFPGAVRAGTAQLEGHLGWKGAPTAFDYDSLNGDMKLEANKGQFLKLDPGAGKLIGLISLQTLPRRVILDFKDVFSDGFAFDNINSKVEVRDGLMRTERLQIDGASARIVMRGEVDLKHETQRLSVNVQPELGSTAALGIALINPLAGVATLLAHKVLQNPLNQMFGFDYRVTGNWDDPKVEKVSGSSPQPLLPRLPTITSNPGGVNESAAK
ncbi:MAG: YhdP family protein [Betaproteobacteria bacterium]